MPEGDTIHKIAAAIRPRLEGETIRAARVRDKAGLDCRLESLQRRVTAVYARGKHLFIDLDKEFLVRSHLGMYGAWHRYRPGESWRKPERHASLALWTDHDVFVCFNAMEVEVLRSTGIRERNLVNRLGPDLLASTVALDTIVSRAREFLEADTLLVDLLLDQRVAAGIGNVYKSEVLFIEEAYPYARLGDLSDASIRGLYKTARMLLERNLGAGHRVTRFVNDGAARLWVYGRRGKPCLRCASPIRYERAGRAMRSTYWSETCQTANKPAQTVSSLCPEHQ